MSGHDLPDAWSGSLDELAVLANRLLPHYLPLDRSGRTQDQISPRLIRHYTTLGLLDEPLKLGREARYSERHLLQVLALRRLMGEGLTAQALRGVLTGRSDDDLRALITGQSRLEVQPQASNPALDFLEALGAPPGLRRSAPAPSPLPAAAAPPPPAAERYSRIPLVPGLELHVARSARLPRTPAEQQALSQALLDALDTLRKDKP